VGPTIITVRPNGPYVVRAGVRVLAADGSPYDTGDREVVKLCRCGGSSTKPFCDGTHSRIGFAGAYRPAQDPPYVDASRDQA
jgi:CDGSH-type Zn-finger protein